MPELTVVADMVWRVAAVEARRGGASVLGVDHLLVALLSLEKLLNPSAGLEPARRELVRADHVVIVQLLARLNQDATTLRRALRRQSRPGAPGANAVIHRDEACRAVFARADALAREFGNQPCGTLHLLAAILESPPPGLVEALHGATGDDALERLRRLVITRITPSLAIGPLPGEPSQSPGAPGPPVTPAVPPTRQRLALPTDELLDGRLRPVAPQLTPTPGQPPSLGEPAADERLSESSQPAPGVLSSPAAPTPAVLLRFGRDLTAEAEAGELGPVIGRHAEMLQVVRVLHRRTKNSPVLIGEAGVGKTAVVEGLACRIAEGTALAGRRIVSLSLPSVVAGTSFRGQFEERLAEILTALKDRPDIILFLDEVHAIVGAGDQDGRMDAATILKPALARGEIACIGATTTDEYQRSIATDPALERRFQPVTVAEPTAAEAHAILAGLRAELERHHSVRIDSSALDAAIELTVRYVPGRRLPDKAVDALDEACARASVPSLSFAARLTDLSQSGGAVVTRETVGEVVSAWTGIPVGRIGQAEAERLADLETRLAERVVGQQEAIRQVAQRVRLARTGMTDPDRPSGVFLFLGPSGVGKTELVRVLAELAVDGPQRLIRLDMSEYGEKHAVARLIGAPPGYQGHGEEGQLTGPLRRSPYAIVLLDEAEKAHPDVFDLFLQLFDAGRLTDGSGRLVDGRQAIFVLTSNLQVSGASRRQIGFGESTAGVSRSGAMQPPATPDRESMLTELRQFFRPELLNRIDEVVLFRPLGESELTEIADRQLRGLRRRLLDQHEIDLAITPLALGFLARQAAAGSGGARELQRIITRLIETPLSHDLLAGEYMRGEHLIAEVSGETLALVRDTRTL